MTVKERIKTKIEQAVTKPVSAMELEDIVLNKGSTLRCSKKWYDDCISELIVEGRLLYISKQAL